jgi:hypothetical protein
MVGTYGIITEKDRRRKESARDVSTIVAQVKLHKPDLCN